MAQPMLSIWMPVLVFVLAFALLMPRPPNCFECGERLSIWSNPFRRSRRLWVERGYRCQNCDCETDMQGRKVAAGNPPRPGAVRNYVLIWAFAGSLAVAFNLLSFAMTRPLPVPKASPALPPRLSGSIAEPSLNPAVAPNRLPETPKGPPA